MSNIYSEASVKAIVVIYNFTLLANQ